MANKYTQKTQEALQQAQMRASAAGNPDMRPAHVLEALLKRVNGALDGGGGVFGTGGVCAVVDGVDAHGRIGHEGLNSFDGYRVRC